MTIPKDLRQFRLSHLVMATFTVAMSGLLFRIATIRPAFFLIAISGFWLGMGLLVLSDTLDPNPPDEKKPVSFVLNTFGLILATICFVSWFGLLVMNLIEFALKYLQ